jgi:DNA-binding transcriptional ArsR family regulator
MKQKSRTQKDAAIGDRDLASIYRCLSKVDRIMILNILGKEEMAAGAIAGTMRMEGKVFTSHIRALKNRGLLSSRKQDGELFLRVMHPEVIEALDRLCSISRQRLHEGQHDSSD